MRAVMPGTTFEKAFPVFSRLLIFDYYEVVKEYIVVSGVLSRPRISELNRGNSLHKHYFLRILAALGNNVAHVS